MTTSRSQQARRRTAKSAGASSAGPTAAELEAASRRLTELTDGNSETRNVVPPT